MTLLIQSLEFALEKIKQRNYLWTKRARNWTVRLEALSAGAWTAMWGQRRRFGMLLQVEISNGATAAYLAWSRRAAAVEALAVGIDARDRDHYRNIDWIVLFFFD